MPFRACKVSFVERGQRHSVDVDAESTYEAAALALKRFHASTFIKGPSRHATLEVEVDRPMRFLAHVKVEKVLHWLYRREPKNEAEAARIKRLRDLLLADDRMGRV